MPLILNGSTGISGTDGSAGTPAVQGTDTNTGIFFPAADTIAFAEGGTEVMRIDASGNVGIGVAAPGYRLDVRDASNTTVHVMANTSGVRVGASADTPVTGAGFVGTYSNHPLTLGANNAERARITTGGEWLVGTSSVVGSGKVGVNFGASGDGIAINNTTTGDRTPIAFYNGNGFVGRISTSGSATAYLTSSDYRLKENVTPLTDAAARVQALKPSRFNFIADPDRTVDGFIAHEAAEVVPEAVHGEKDAVNEDGSIKPQGIDQSKLVPLLTAALQEALTEIAALKARVAVLEAN